MTQLTAGSLSIPVSRLGPENPLPAFRDAAPDARVTVTSAVPAADRCRLGWQIGRRVLPHRMQDRYGASPEPAELPTLTLENDVLRAVFLPSLGGRLFSLVHVPSGRELLARNPAVRFANLALRNAWFSGGVEWNPSLFGHHHLTCAPVFAARITGPRGEPVLRIYEWDRVKLLAWQVDFHLPDGSGFLFARARMVNPLDREAPAYWWSNIAVPEDAGTRVLAPAAEALTHVPPLGLDLAVLPRYRDVDSSYPARQNCAGELFFRVAGRPWVAALDAGGCGLVETSTARLSGRKLFFWGRGRGGRRWQELLGSGGPDYAEIQAGLARTQIESVPMPARTHWSWTEAFGRLAVAPGEAHAADWATAVRAAGDALEEALPAAQMEKIDRELSAAACRAPEEILHRGSGWGALERRRLARLGQPDRIPSELVFSETDLGQPQDDWLHLLERGELPERDAADPGAWMVQLEWQEILESALAAGRGDHWLARLHLGNMRMEALDPVGARAAWEESLRRRRTSWALRNLAVLESREGRADRAAELFAEAWAAGPRPDALALETASALYRAGRFADAAAFAAGLPPELAGEERIALVAARSALELGDFAAVERFFDRRFSFVREGDRTLTDLWFAMHERRLAAAAGAAVDDALRERVRREFPPPAHIDFRMG